MNIMRAAGAPDREPAAGITSLRERREPLFVRISVNLPGVLVSVPAGRTIPGWIENISVGGMYFRAEDPIAVGTELYCILVEADGTEGEELFAAGRVVHRDERGFGIAFEKLTPTAFNAISAMIAASGVCLLRVPSARAEGAREVPARARAPRRHPVGPEWTRVPRAA